MIEGQSLSLTELLEVRLGLECNSAVLAARRANEEDIVLLERSLAQMSEHIKKGGWAVRKTSTSTCASPTPPRTSCKCS